MSYHGVGYGVWGLLCLGATISRSNVSCIRLKLLAWSKAVESPGLLNCPFVACGYVRHVNVGGMRKSSKTSKE
jgi:hypothetical protein